MSKRKRSEEATDGNAIAVVNYRQQRRIVGAFTQSTKELAKAFKTARGFERQKLGRRKKNAATKKDERDMQRIDSEIAALKALDITACAFHYLQKSLLKIKPIVASPELPTELAKSAPLSKDAAALNVTARLCNSNPVKDAFPKLFSDVKKEFGLDEERNSTSKKPKIDKKGVEEVSLELVEESEYGTDEDMEEKKLSSSKPRARTSQGIAHSGSSDSEENLDLYAGRLASSDDENSESEVDLDIEELEKQLEAEGISRTSANSKTISTPYDHAADLSLSDDELEDIVDEEPKKTTVAKKSSFIPSLTLGGYISGSGSDLDDEVDVAPKKNRRGQRARQQIWEKKYGKSAKHLQQQQRSAGWDAKRGAVDSTGKSGKHGTRQSRFAKGANTERLGKSRLDPIAAVKKPLQKDDGGPLHPSWEAAKRAKEKSLAPVKFQGSKISFD